MRKPSIIRDNSVKTFLEHVSDLLYKDEATSSLMLGLCSNLNRASEPAKNPSVFFRVVDDDVTVTAAVKTSTNLILTFSEQKYLKELASYFKENHICPDGVVGPARESEIFSQIWKDLTSTEFSLGMSQKIYQIEKVNTPEGAGNCRLACTNEIDLITQWLVEFSYESLPSRERLSFDERRPQVVKAISDQNAFLWLVENTPVSMTFVGRPTQNGVSVSAVYTPKNFRKNGYASALVASVSQKMFDSGKKFCVLYTDASNPTSNKIYQNVGYKEVSDSKHFLFDNWPSSFSRFSSHYSLHTETQRSQAISSDFVHVIDSDLGRSVPFNRIAIHHVVLPAGYRSSFPHAESLEEEFVFVLKGKPDLWLNGFIYELDKGFAVGFPAGTGIGHTVINNTDTDVHLLVVGDKTKNDNLCSFPINPELQSSSPIWWDQPPSQKLGSHNGLPGSVRPEDRAPTASQFVIDCKIQTKRKPFHYPGDSESFGEGFRITDLVGLKNLGIWYDTLKPGVRTSFPHAHTHEEEFIYILSGHPTLWLDGFVKKMGPGEFAAFPSNTGLAHTLINDTDEEVTYICIGETFEFPDEKITYPLNPLRQQECRRKGWYWDELKTSVSGPHSAKSIRDTREHIEFHICSTHDASQVLKVFETSPGYFMKVDGCLPTIKTAQQELAGQPKKINEKYFKESLIIKINGESIGFLDLHAHHPEPDVCYLGLFLISESLFSRGLGTKCYQLAEDYILRAFSCKRILLGVSGDNDVSGFWHKMGFEFNGKTYDWKGEQKVTSVKEMSKSLK